MQFEDSPPQNMRVASWTTGGMIPASLGNFRELAPVQGLGEGARRPIEVYGKRAVKGQRDVHFP